MVRTSRVPSVTRTTAEDSSLASSKPSADRRLAHQDAEERVQATTRNAAGIEAGRVSLLGGSVSALPWAPESFDKVVTVNSMHFWPDLVQGLGRSGGSSAREAGWW